MAENRRHTVNFKLLPLCSLLLSIELPSFFLYEDNGRIGEGGWVYDSIIRNTPLLSKGGGPGGGINQVKSLSLALLA